MCRFFVGIACVLFVGLVWGYNLEARFAPPDSGYPSTPAVGDVDGDGVPEIVFGTGPGAPMPSPPWGHLYIVSKDVAVTMEHEFNLGGAVYSPSIGDLDCDGTVEIVVYVWDGAGKVVCLHADGTIAWQRVINLGYGYHCWDDHNPALGDLNGDGVADVALVAGASGEMHKLVAISGADGTELWQAPMIMGLRFNAVAILDIDRDGRNEVIASVDEGPSTDTNGIMKVFRSDGSLWWSRGNYGDFGVADFDLDGWPEIVAVGADTVALYTYNGDLINSVYAPGTRRYSAPTIADFDGDGFPEFAVGTSWTPVGSIYAFDYNPATGSLSLMWSRTDLGVGEWDNPDLTSADFGCDSIPDIITISDDVALAWLNGETGATIETWTVSINENEHSCALADVDGDGYGEVIVPSGDGHSIPGTGPATYNRNLLIFGNDGVWGYGRTVWNQMAFWQSNLDGNLCVSGGDYTPWLMHPRTNIWRSLYCYPCAPEIDSIWFAEETDCNDINIVRICYDLYSDCTESTYTVSVSMSSDSGATWVNAGTGWFVSIYDTEGVLGDGIPAGEHCFNWLMSADMIAEGRNWRLRVIAEGNILADTVFASAPLDSRSPRVSLSCSTEALSASDTLHLRWTVTDTFWNEDTSIVRISYCGAETTFFVPDTFAEAFSLKWVIPEPSCCPVCTVVVAVRDSFCNWGYDSCTISLICTPATASVECAPCGGLTSCENQIASFLITEPCGIDTMRTFFTVRVVHASGTSDTFSLAEPTDSLAFDCLGAPPADPSDSVRATIQGFYLLDGDSVSITLDSLFDEAGCRALP